jgi:hypothetical protein
VSSRLGGRLLAQRLQATAFMPWLRGAEGLLEQGIDVAEGVDEPLARILLSGPMT